MHIKIEGMILCKQDWNGEMKYTFAEFEMPELGYAKVCDHTLTAELPEGFNPVVAEIEALNKAINAIQDEAMAKVCALKDRISKLQAIEYTAPATV